MNAEKRMIHSYEVVSSLKIGEKEVVLAMDEKNTDGERYMTCFVERNDLFELYHESVVSDDYAEIAKIYGSRIANEAELWMEQAKKLGIPISIITANDCIPDHYSHDLNGKIIAIDAKHLRPEFQRADKQLYLVYGGFGASPNSRGSAVFCTNLYSGRNTRMERYQVLGEVKPECMPEWAKEKAEALKRAEKKRNREAER